jgi:RNA polymerase sigma-70 factor (ECF subfamily)
MRDTSPTPSDAQLIERLLAGDPNAGQLLYDRLIRIVDWTLRRLLGRDRTDHEDLVQNAFEQIVTTLYKDTFARSCSLTSWAAAVTARIALTELRSQRRRTKNLGARVELSEQALSSSSLDLESQAAARLELERIRRVLPLVHPDNAQVLVMHEVGGLELSEIGRTLGLSVGAVQSRLWRGRKELLERLAEPQELS